MRIGLMATLAGGLALAGCAYPYSGAPGYGYGYGGDYGYGGYGPSYAAPAYAQAYGYSPGYVQPYRYGGYGGGWRGGDRDHGGNWHGQSQGGWHGQQQSGWHGQSGRGGGQLSRSTQPAQRAATPQTKSFERAMGFRPD